MRRLFAGLMVAMAFLVAPVGRSVSFRIYMNRTPSTTAHANPLRPAGRFAGRTLCRQDRGSMDMGEGRKVALADFAVFLGPSNFQNLHAVVSQREFLVMCIVVWAWIESRPTPFQGMRLGSRKFRKKSITRGCPNGSSRAHVFR
jgi:hypothetical protein